MVWVVYFKCLLGPFLFLIFVNNLPAIFQNSCLLFTDDLKIFSVVRNDDAKTLQNDLTDLTFWTNSWRLSLNVSKCWVLYLGRTNHNYTYTLDGNDLQDTSVMKDLGITIDRELKFHDQTATIVTTYQS